MTVGPNFMSPETQAAIAAQSGGAAPTQGTVVESTTEDTKVTEPEVKTDQDQQTSEPLADTKQEPTQSDGDSLDMSQTKTQTPEEVDAALKEAGFTPEDLGKELAENDGKFSEATEKALREKFGDDAVDAHLTDIAERWKTTEPERKEAVDKANANVEQMNTFIYESLAGGDAEKGKTNLKVLSDWCRDNMSESQLKSINTLLASGDKDVVKDGLQQAVSAWKKGTEKPMMTGDAQATTKEPTAPKLEPLSKDQYIEIVCSEKYNTDAEYATKIDARRRATMANESYITPEFSGSRPPIR